MFNMVITMSVVIKDLVKIYEKPQRTVVLDKVSLRVEGGEWIVIEGISGCGKSTLLKVLAGIEEPTCGEVFVCGVDLFSLSEGEREKFRLKNVGIVFQLRNLIPWMTIAENLELPLISLGAPREDRRRRVVEVAGELGLKDKLDRLPSQVSVGEMQLASLARALVCNAKLLLLDEITANLDSSNSRRVHKVIKDRVGRGITVVMASNDPLSRVFADRVFKLESGRLIELPRRGFSSRSK